MTHEEAMTTLGAQLQEARNTIAEEQQRLFHYESCMAEQQREIERLEAAYAELEAELESALSKVSE